MSVAALVSAMLQELRYINRAAYSHPLVEQFASSIDDPLGALSLAQLLRTCRDSEQ